MCLIAALECAVPAAGEIFGLETKMNRRLVPWRAGEPPNNHSWSFSKVARVLTLFIHPWVACGFAGIEVHIEVANWWLQNLSLVTESLTGWKTLDFLETEADLREMAFSR